MLQHSNMLNQVAHYTAVRRNADMHQISLRFVGKTPRSCKLFFLRVSLVRRVKNPRHALGAE